ncbi:MAG: AAA family ATPase [Desulfobacteraceae bacterium]|nr:AAA family ATPase [Desulfobacteraceae bacterium]
MKKKQKLIFIGGPPGVGKTTVTRLVLGELNHSIRVDGDELWFHMNPFTPMPVSSLVRSASVFSTEAILTVFQ